MTEGAQPVGRGLGPALEARDVLAVLRGDPDAPADLRERALLLAGYMLELAGAAAVGGGQALARGRSCRTGGPGGSSRRSATRRAACASRRWPAFTRPSGHGRAAG